MSAPEDAIQPISESVPLKDTTNETAQELTQNGTHVVVEDSTVNKPVVETNGITDESVKTINESAAIEEPSSKVEDVVAEEKVDDVVEPAHEEVLIASSVTEDKENVEESLADAIPEVEVASAPVEVKEDAIIADEKPVESDPIATDEPKVVEVNSEPTEATTEVLEAPAPEKEDLVVEPVSSASQDIAFDTSEVPSSIPIGNDSHDEDVVPTNEPAADLSVESPQPSLEPTSSAIPNSYIVLSSSEAETCFPEGETPPPTESTQPIAAAAEESVDEPVVAVEVPHVEEPVEVKFEEPTVVLSEPLKVEEKVDEDIPAEPEPIEPTPVVESVVSEAAEEKAQTEDVVVATVDEVEGKSEDVPAAVESAEVDLKESDELPSAADEVVHEVAAEPVAEETAVPVVEQEASIPVVQEEVLAESAPSVEAEAVPEETPVPVQEQTLPAEEPATTEEHIAEVESAVVQEKPEEAVSNVEVASAVEEPAVPEVEPVSESSLAEETQESTGVVDAEVVEPAEALEERIKSRSKK
ncbi:hypothetical protein C8Q75DRAFT_426394 [Abortiporus biennis]|nr:hypothetical protein C8Q75DRAFT_426394 [Abortiporus biennis]